MKKALIFCFLSLGIWLHVAAQENPMVTGLLAFNNGDYPSAVQKLDQVLEEPEAHMKGHNTHIVHYYLAQSYIRISEDGMLQSQYPSATSKALDHFLNAKKEWQHSSTTEDETFERAINLTGQYLWTPLFNEGAFMYNSGKFEEAIQYFSDAEKADPSNPLAGLYAGYALLITNDTAQAIQNWASSIKLFEADEALGKSGKAMEFAGAYLSLAGAYFHYQKDINAAKSMVEKGRRYFPDDPDLEKAELSLLEGNLDPAAGALDKFAAAAKKKSASVEVLVSYAALLMNAGNDKEALSTLQAAQRKAPEDFSVNLNLAAYYVNQAKKLSEVYNETQDEQEAGRLYNEIQQLFLKAYPHMKKVQKAEPDNIEWVNQMIQITGFLDKKSELQEYYERQKALRK